MHRLTIRQNACEGKLADTAEVWRWCGQPLIPLYFGGIVCYFFFPYSTHISFIDIFRILSTRWIRTNLGKNSAVSSFAPMHWSCGMHPSIVLTPAGGGGTNATTLLTSYPIWELQKCLWDLQFEWSFEYAFIFSAKDTKYESFHFITLTNTLSLEYLHVARPSLQQRETDFGMTTLHLWICRTNRHTKYTYNILAGKHGRKDFGFREMVWKML
jgi:hypothetical protein